MRVASCEIRVASFWPVAGCQWPFSYRYQRLPTAYCLLLIAYSLLLTAYCLLLTAYCLLLIAYCLLLIAYCLLPTAYRLLSTLIVPIKRSRQQRDFFPYGVHGIVRRIEIKFKVYYSAAVFRKFFVEPFDNIFGQQDDFVGVVLGVVPVEEVQHKHQIEVLRHRQKM
jgi:hypothetical protein